MLCQDLNNLARKIIAQNQYMIIGSSSESNAWVSPVVYAPDSDYNLYFVSLPNSKHSENIASNSQTCISIFNSHQPFGEGVGLQIEGEAQQVNNSELVHAIRIYATRKWPYSNNILKTYIEGFKKVLNNNTYRVYVFKPKKVWMNDPNADVDVRVEVKLFE